MYVCMRAGMHVRENFDYVRLVEFKIYECFITNCVILFQ